MAKNQDNTTKKPFKVMSTVGLSVAVLGSSIPFGSGQAHAKDIHDYDKMTTINDKNKDSEKIPQKYSNVAKFTDKTKLKTFGDVKWKDTNWNTNSTAKDKAQRTTHFTDGSKLPKDFGAKYTLSLIHI